MSACRTTSGRGPLLRLIGLDLPWCRYRPGRRRRCRRCDPPRGAGRGALQWRRLAASHLPGLSGHGVERPTAAPGRPFGARGRAPRGPGARRCAACRVVPDRSGPNRVGRGRRRSGSAPVRGGADAGTSPGRRVEPSLGPARACQHRLAEGDVSAAFTAAVDSVGPARRSQPPGNRSSHAHHRHHRHHGGHDHLAATLLGAASVVYPNVRHAWTSEVDGVALLAAGTFASAVGNDVLQSHRARGRALTVEEALALATTELAR